ncbi:unnamed protein product [Mytilus coruscus]|uniref:Uncharacterized protein n=1 Tax=Mytilus coruscus TaxID=42192 RepID=A0A6J8ADA0_MYTCO|nr:unnamed protein product [Mytilus coruscus]
MIAWRDNGSFNEDRSTNDIPPLQNPSNNIVNAIASLDDENKNLHDCVDRDDFLLYNQITDDIEPDIGYLLQPPACPLQLNTSFSLPNIETPATPPWAPFDQFQTSDFTNSSTPNTVVSSILDDEVQPTTSNFKHNSFHKMEKLANCRKFGGYPHENAF